MTGEYMTGIQCDIQSLINDTIVIKSSLNKKTVLLEYHHVKDIMAVTVMIMPWIKTRKYLSDTFMNR